MAPSGVNNAMRSMASMFAAMWGGLYDGTSRPDRTQAGSFWRDTSQGPAENWLTFYDGTNDIRIYPFNLTTGVVGRTEGAVIPLSGTEVDITGIPAWAKRVQIVIDNMGTNETASAAQGPIMQVGGAGGFVSAGYIGGGVTTSAIATGTAPATTGFPLVGTWFNSIAYFGTAEFINYDGETWIATATGHGTRTVAPAEDHLFGGGGRITMAERLTSLRLTNPNGTNLFTGGNMKAYYYP